MLKKWAPFLLVVLMGIALFFLKQCVNGRKQPSQPKTTTTRPAKDPASTVNRDRGFDRRTSYLEYSAHAKCRMQCRKISQAEVEDIMRNGTINYKKSDIQNARCPRYALEGTTQDNQRVRIIFAQCNTSTTVVTVIDLGTDWQCDCPGDDDQYKNKR